MASSPTISQFAEVLAKESRWYTLGVFIGVSSTDMDSIDHNHGREDTMRCLIEIYKRMESKGESLSWKHVVESLKKMENYSLADRIHSDYILSSLRHSTESSVPNIPPPAATAHQGSTVVVGRSSEAEAEETVKFITKEFTTLSERFATVETMIKKAFEESMVETGQLQDLIENQCGLEPLPEEKATVNMVFRRLRQHYSMLNFRILTFLVKTLLSKKKKLQKEVADCEAAVNGFKASAKIKHLAGLITEKQTITGNHKIVELKVREFWNHFTMRQFEIVMAEILKTLYDLASQISVVKGCICVSWVIPDIDTAKLIEPQPMEFIRVIGVISLHVGDSVIYNIPGEGCEVLEAAMLQAIELKNTRAIELLLAVGCNPEIATYKGGKAVANIASIRDSSKTTGALEHVCPSVEEVKELKDTASSKDLRGKGHSESHVWEIARIGSRLGVGAYGEVQEYTLTDGRTVAGKRIHELLLSEDSKHSMNRHIYNESEKLSQLSHPNIVQYIGLAYTSPDHHPILLTELLPMSLSDYLDQASKQEAIIPPHTKRSILLDVSLGLQYLHSKDVIHGDLTAKNVLLTQENKAKICSFGTSEVFDPRKLYMILPGCPGTVAYMPPEAQTTDHFRVERSHLDRLDVFSFGVLILHVYTQRFPEVTSAFDENLQPRTEVQRRQNLIDGVRKYTFRQLAEHCLRNLPQCRPSSDDLVRRIKGSQLQGIAIFVSNKESTQDDYPGEELHKLARAFGFVDLSFTNLSSEALHALLQAAVKSTVKCNLPAIALFILAEEKDHKLCDANKEPMPIQDILAHFFDPKLDAKPKMFYLQHEDRSHYPHNSIILPQMFKISSSWQDLEAGIALEDLLEMSEVQYQSTITSKCILTTPSSDQTEEGGELQTLNLHYQATLTIWLQVREHTIRLLEEHEEDIFEVVRNTRITKIAGAATSLVVGGTLAVVGIALIPFTFGASVGLTVAGVGVGVAGTATVMGASIVSRVMSNKKLKTAQEHITLDQQISRLVNDTATHYNEAVQSNGLDFVRGGIGVGSLLGVALAGSRLGVALAGGVLGGGALLVTAPLDIHQIVKNARDLAAPQIEHGNEKDAMDVWYSNVINTMKKEVHSVPASSIDDT